MPEINFWVDALCPSLSTLTLNIPEYARGGRHNLGGVPSLLYTCSFFVYVSYFQKFGCAL